MSATLYGDFSIGLYSIGFDQGSRKTLKKIPNGKVAMTPGALQLVVNGWGGGGWGLV